MGVKNNLQSIYKNLNDPFYQVNWIYNHFNQNVPYISVPPTLKEYDLPENIEERIAEEGKNIERRIGLIEFILYVIGFFLVFSYVIQTPDYKDSVWSALLCTAGTYGWMALIAYEMLFSGYVSNIQKKKKESTPLYKRYTQYKNAQYAYLYWSETASLTYWMSLDGHQFEDSVAAVYRSNGFKATVSKQGGDGGVDIILEKEGRRIAVQCKAHKSQIGPSVARDLYGTMLHLGISEGIIVSRSGFTAGVYDFVIGKPILLTTLSDLLRMQKTKMPRPN